MTQNNRQDARQDNMKTIDLENWPRASHYHLFRKVTQPHLGLVAPVEVTPLMEVYKKDGLSVFNVALFAIMRAANNLPAFRTRFRGDSVVEHDVVHASITVPIKDERFAFCEIDYQDDFHQFNSLCQARIRAAENQTDLVDNIVGQDNWLYLSCLPWVNFTAMNNPLNGPDDCIPRIVWGMMTRAHNRWHMPVGVEAHHSLVDGLHIAQFFKNIENILGDIKTFLP